jgi:RTX calcium-binding nonapeptide repeat (4 copies)
MSRAGLLALAAAAAALVLPASSLAATVGVEEPAPVPPAPAAGEAKLTFVAGPGEANRLTVSVAGENADFYDLRLVDGAVQIQAGPGCRGGGAAGVPVLCKVRKPTLGDDYSCFKTCHATPGTAWDLNLSFALGGAGSGLDTTALPGVVPNKDTSSPSAPVQVTVVPGPGGDTVLTGPGPDRIEASGGADLVRTGDGPDYFGGGPVADGPDRVDLGKGRGDTIDYSERGEGVRYEADGQADDGAAGEADDLGAAEYVRGGAGADTLISPRASLLDSGARIDGGADDDFIVGNEGNDGLFGGSGNDDLHGGAGDDALRESANYVGAENSGNDSADGGPGDDEIDPGRGDDETAGGPGEDRIFLGPGRDTAAGGEGDDVLLGEAGGDEIAAGPGRDRLSGDVGSDRLFGGGGADRVAAGMVVPWAWIWGHRTFLRAPGPLEGRPDEVGCGTGRDVVKVGSGDGATGCEGVLRAEPLELRGFLDGTPHFSPQVKFTIRRPGTARLSGKGLKPVSHTFRRDYGAFTFGLGPVGRARRALLRDGRVSLRLRLSYRAADGREVVWLRTIELRQREELEVHERPEPRS